MVSNTTDKQGAIDLLEKAIEVIGDEIRKEEGGSLVVTMKPKAVSETDDLELAALMDRVARENKEVSGELLLLRREACVQLADVLCAFQVTRTRTESRGRGCFEILQLDAGSSSCTRSSSLVCPASCDLGNSRIARISDFRRGRSALAPRAFLSRSPLTSALHATPLGRIATVRPRSLWSSWREWI